MESDSSSVISEEMLEGNHIPDTAGSISPEVEIWLAVVARAWADAFEASDISIRSTDRRCEPDMVRAEARRWLLLDFGEWKSDREEICCAAGLDPDAIRAAAIRRNKLSKVEDAERRKIEIMAIDRAMANLLAREHTLPRGEVTSTLRELAAREDRLAFQGSDWQAPGVLV